MNLEKWQAIKNRVLDDFTVLDQGQETSEEDGGSQLEFLEFDSPLGRLRLEFISRPEVLDKQTHYSNRIGAETQVAYVYGENLTHHLAVYRWDEATADWQALDPRQFKL